MNVLQEIERFNVEVKLPETLQEITPELLAEFDIHNIQQQYEIDLKAFAYFQLLEKEVLKKLRWEKFQEEQIESQTFVSIQNALTEDGKKVTSEYLKKLVITDTRNKMQVEKVIKLENARDTIQGILDVLKTKAIALNVLVARERAEIQSGLR